MRTAIVSDIHGNLTAFEAVLADLRKTAPDLIVHGGDLADFGSNPAAIVDQIRDLGWPGVYGNTDEMLFAPHSLNDFANRLPQLRPMFDAIEEMAAYARASLGVSRLAWLRSLPRIALRESFALVHASTACAWNAPAPDASDFDLAQVYQALARPLAVYGHIHRPYIRRMPRLTVANSGSVSLSYDGDPRASYLLIDDSVPVVRRVQYNVDREIRAITAAALPHADWVARILRSAMPQVF